MQSLPHRLQNFYKKTITEMRYIKPILISLIIPSLVFLYQNLSAFSGGIVGQTKRTTSVGCSCHGSTPTTTVSAIIVGPSFVGKSDTATFQLRLSGGPLVKGGVDISPQRGHLILSPLETGLKRVSASGGIFELTHVSPKAPNVFTNDTIVWTFKYVAPDTVGTDSIFANGNSVDGTGGTAGDQWNFAVTKQIFLSAKSGITQINQIACAYKLNQNYPNPFNPSTKINYSILKNGFVSLKVYNQLGQVVSNLVSENQNAGSYAVDFDGSGFSSGFYYYMIEANDFIETKKMILSK